VADEAAPEETDEPVPKLPRAPLFGKPSLNGVVRVGMFATLLYAIIVMRRPCAEGVGRFIGGFDEPVDADAAPPSVSDQYPGYELMTAEEALKRWPDNPTRDGGLGDAAAVVPASPTPEVTK
jgi:hypothetical protein